MDHFDDRSIHVGGTDGNGSMQGTIRLVRHSSLGFPLFGYCEIYPEFRHLISDQIFNNCAEVSRLAISKARKAKSQIPTSMPNPENPPTVQSLFGSRDRTEPGEELRHTRSDIILGLYKAIYQASKREGITHWLAAMEKSLLRLMRRFHFDFTPIGPEVHYHGLRVPYMVAISTIEDALSRHCPETFSDFIRELEPELLPGFPVIDE